MTTQTRIWVPEISDKEVYRFYDHVRPVKESPKGFYAVVVNDLRRTSIFDQRNYTTGQLYDLRRMCDIVTYHKIGENGQFHPTLPEFFAQLPWSADEALKEAPRFLGFQIVSRPDECADFNTREAALADGYHMAITRLYRQRY